MLGGNSDAKGKFEICVDRQRFSEAAIGALNIVIGAVKLFRGEVLIAPPTIGDPLYHGDRLETGDDGLVQIVFVGGTKIDLCAAGCLKFERSEPNSTKSVDSTLVRVVKGIFNILSNRADLDQCLILDTPVGQLRNRSPALGFGSVAFGIFTFSLIRALSADSADVAVLDNGTVNYQDLKHGVFEIVTKGDHPQVIVVDDPTQTIVIRPRGSGIAVQAIQNTQAQMAQFQNAYDHVWGTYLEGQQDAFIQQWQHADAQPQSTGAGGSSTSIAFLLNGGSPEQLIVETGAPINLTNNSLGGNSANPALDEFFIIQTPSIPNVIYWEGPNGIWSIGFWNDGQSVPLHYQTVIINPFVGELTQPVTVELERTILPDAVDNGGAVQNLVIGPANVLDITNNGALLDSASLSNIGSLTVSNILDVFGTLELRGDPPSLLLIGTVTVEASGVIEASAGVVTVLGANVYNAGVIQVDSGGKIVVENGALVGGTIVIGDIGAPGTLDITGTSDIANVPSVAGSSVIADAVIISIDSSDMLLIDEPLAFASNMVQGGTIIFTANGQLYISGSTVIDANAVVDGSAVLGGAPITIELGQTLTLDNAVLTDANVSLEAGSGFFELNGFTRFGGEPVINNAGQILGGSSDVAGNTSTIVYDPITGADSSFEVLLPNKVASTETIGLGLNDAGQIVGTYTDSGGALHGFIYSGSVYTYDATKNAFVFSGGTATTLDDPLSGFGVGQGTSAIAINNSGQVIGTYDAGIDYGFFYDPRDLPFDQFTTLAFPSKGVTNTTPTALNDLGEVVGTFIDSSGLQHGFIYDNGPYVYDLIHQTFSSNGAYKTLDDPVPGAKDTTPLAINVLGQVVGTYEDSSNALHGFFYDPFGGFVSLAPAAGATQVTPSAINSTGDVVGTYTDTSGVLHGFVYDPATNGYTILTDPSAGTASGEGTEAFSINNAGQIVGTYFDANNVEHAFVDYIVPAALQVDGSVTLTFVGSDTIDNGRLNNAGTMDVGISSSVTANVIIKNENGGTLAMPGSGPNILNDVGGTIEVRADSTLTFINDTVSGGTIIVDSGGTLILTDTHILNNVNIDIESGGVLEIFDTVEIDTQLSVLLGQTTVGSGQVLDFSSELILGGLIVDGPSGLLNAGSVNLLGNDTIDGDSVRNGQVLQGALTSAGIINVTGADTIQNEDGKAPGGSNIFSNTGTLEVFAGSTLTLINDVVVDRLVASFGLIQIDAASGVAVAGILNLTGNDTINDGILNNAGAINIGLGGGVNGSALIENENASATTNIFTNTGTLEVFSGSTLTLTNDMVVNRLIASFGLIQIDAAPGVAAAAILNLTGNDIIDDGILNNAGAINIGLGGGVNGSVLIENENASATTNIFTNTGTLTVNSGSQLTLTDDKLENTGGVITVDSDSTLNVVGTLTLTGNGGGQLSLSGGSISGQAAGNELDNVDNTIVGTGTISNLDLDNAAAGIIDAKAGTLTLTTGTTIDNAGLLEATAGGELNVNAGTLSNSGRLIADGGTINVNAIVTQAGGTITISDGGTLDFEKSAAESLTFGGTGDTLELNEPAQCTGTISGFGIGDTIDLLGTTVATVLWNGSTLSIDGTPTTFAFNGIPLGDTFAFSSDGSGGTNLFLRPQVVALAPSSALGVEGSPIALNFGASVTTGASLSSLTISNIPAGATLTDAGHNTLTIASGAITLNAAELAAGYLNGLSITPTNDHNFTLNILAAATDGGLTYDASATEFVTVGPLAPTVTWRSGGSGPLGSQIHLGVLSATVNGLSGDANSLQSLIVSAIPVGDQLTDSHGNSFTATAGDTSVDVKAWSLSTLSIVLATVANAPVTATATVIDADGNTSTANAIELFKVFGPAGISGAPINLALTNPESINHGAILVTITDVPAGWQLNEGSSIGNGTWTVETENPTSLTVMTPVDYAGAKVLNLTESWTEADGSVASAIVADNVEAFAPRTPIFALSGNDTLSGDGGHDLFVLAQPIGEDRVHDFNIISDIIDLIGFNGILNFNALQLADDADGDAVITVGAGENITLFGVHASSLSATDFVFDQTPVVNNASTISISDGAVLPLGGMVENTGAIELHSTGDQTELQVVGNGLTFEGGGQVILSGSSGNIIAGVHPSEILVNADNIISGSGSIGIGDGNLTLSNQLNGIIDANIAGQSLIVDTGNAVVNSGLFEATNGGILQVDDTITGGGNIVVAGGTVVVEAQSTATVTFDNAQNDHSYGELVVGVGSMQSDHIDGFAGAGIDLARSDAIDLTGINYNSDIFSETYNASNGLFTATDGVNAAAFTLDNFAGALSLESDGSGGTLITALTASASATESQNSESSNTSSTQAPSASQPVSVAIGGPGNDSFVFAPGIGADTIVKFDPQQDTLDLSHFTDMQTIQELQSIISEDVHGDAVINLGHQDSITLAGITETQLQQVIQAGHVLLH